MKLVCSVLIILNSVFLNSQECTVSKEIDQGVFNIKLPDEVIFNNNPLHAWGKLNKTIDIKVEFKSPKEVSESKMRRDIIECPGLSFIPGFIDIDKIQVTDVEGVPHGVKWKYDREDMTYKGGENACMFFYGKPNRKGIYDLKINFKGTAKVFGFNVSMNCSLINYKIYII